MERIHIGLKVNDIETSIAFYSKLLGSEPTLRKADYAKWMLDDPRLNFSINLHGDGPPGSAHFGIQVESDGELSEMRIRLDAAGLARDDEEALVCGYQTQNKSWVIDPQGVPWETFYTFGQSNTYGGDFG